MPELSDTARVLLVSASTDERGLVHPDASKTAAAAKQQVFRSLLKRGFIVEQPATKQTADLAYTTDATGRGVVAAITDEGLLAIGVTPDEDAEPGDREPIFPAQDAMERAAKEAAEAALEGGQDMDAVERAAKEGAEAILMSVPAETVAAYHASPEGQQMDAIVARVAAERRAAQEGGQEGADTAGGANPPGDAPEAAQPPQDAPRVTLRDAALQVLAAWDAADAAKGTPESLVAISEAIGALRFHVAKPLKAAKPARDPAAPSAPRAGTKREMVIGMLRRAEGATLDDIMTAIGWQAHSVRGFFAGLKKEGLAVTSAPREAAEGEKKVLVYRI